MIKKIEFTVIIIGIMIFASCNSGQNDTIKPEGALKDFYVFFDQLIENLHYRELANQYNEAYGRNDDGAMKEAEAELNAVHEKSIELINQKFSEGSLKFPFEQSGIENLVNIKSVYISGYMFPCTTAERTSFYLTFEYDLHITDFHYKTVRAEFYDVDGTILHGCSVPLYNTGKTIVLVKAEGEFRRFLKIKVFSSEI